MELLSVFKSENQRTLLTQLLPGSLALWPFAFLVVSGVAFDLDYTQIWNNLVLISIYLFVAMGVGALLEDIGALFERKLEDVYFNLKAKEAPPLNTSDPLSPRSMFESIIRHTTSWLLVFIPAAREWLFGCHITEREANLTNLEIKKNFYSTWDKYLALVQEKEPIAMRYYRSILIRFKFELNSSAALMLMLLGHVVLKIRLLGLVEFLGVFRNWDTWIYLIGVFCTVSILLIEAFKSIELLNELRIKMTRAEDGSHLTYSTARRSQN